MVEKHGIDYIEKETVRGLSGQLFCRDSAKLIVAMLVGECRRVGVEIKLDCETGAVIHAAATWGKARPEDRPLAGQGFLPEK